MADNARIFNDQILLEGLYVDEEQNIVRKGSISGNLSQAAQLGEQLAHKLKYGGSL